MHPPLPASFGPLLRAIPDAVLLVNDAFVVVSASARAERLFGHQPHQLDGCPVRTLLIDLIPLLDLSALHAEDEPAGAEGDPLGAGAPQSWQVHGQRQDGTEFPAEVSAGVLLQDGQRLAVLTIRDDTPRRRSEDRFRRLLEAAPDAIIIADTRGRIALVNEQAEALFGYPRAQLLDQPVEVLMPAAYRAAHPAHREGYFKLPRTRPMGDGGLALFGRRKDGTEFPAEISLSPLGNDDEMVAITAIRDLTQRKKDEEGRLKLSQTQEALRMRDEFLSIASHELKTPLTALLMQADTLIRASRRGGLQADRVAAKASSIHRAALRLTALINQLLDLSRITGGRLTLERESTDLAAVVRGAAALFQDELAQTGCQLILRADQPVMGQWDPLRIEQVITNLVANALKYGPGRPIELIVELNEDVSHPRRARLIVRDHGIGIAPEHQARIFERFERILPARNYGGFGLGLWISRQIIEAHEGTIQVSSQPGEGSTFTVELPIDEAATAASGEGHSTRPCVLLVDDDAMIRASLQEALQDEGIQVLTAENGRAALKLLRGGVRPCVILLDLMMPVMDAFAFRAEQGRDPRIADIPVVVLSAADHLEQRTSGLGEVAGILKKPLDLDVLLGAVRMRCSGHGPRAQ